MLLSRSDNMCHYVTFLLLVFVLRLADWWKVSKILKSYFKNTVEKAKINILFDVFICKCSVISKCQYNRDDRIPTLKITSSLTREIRECYL